MGRLISYTPLEKSSTAKVNAQIDSNQTTQFTREDTQELRDSIKNL